MNATAINYRVGKLPIGQVFLASSERGLILIELTDQPERVAKRLQHDLGVPAIEEPAKLERTWGQLKRYFDRRLRRFSVAIDTSLATPFQRRVMQVLSEVPYGCTDTYGGLAQRIGQPRAARAVGRALNRNPIPIIVPCHRILGKDGDLVGYRGGLGLKKMLLGLEGYSSSSPALAAASDHVLAVA